MIRFLYDSYVYYCLKIARTCHGRGWFNNLIAHIATICVFPLLMAKTIIHVIRNKNFKYANRIDETPIVVSAMPCPCLMELPDRTCGVVSLCPWYETFLFCHFWKLRKIPVLHSPCLDHYGTLSIPKMNIVLDFIIEHAPIKGDVVIVHCKGGKGRSAMVAACFLIRECGITATEARREIKETRPQSSITGVKWETVVAFEKSLNH